MEVFIFREQAVKLKLAAFPFQKYGTVLEYLLSPVQKAFQEAGRER